MGRKEVHMQKNGIRVLLLVVAAALIAVGIAGGGAWDVMNKAIRICFECIGIG